MIRYLLFCSFAILTLGNRINAKELATASGPLLSAVNEYIADIKPELDQLSADRRRILDKFAEEISESIRKDGSTKLNFICSHNSRRSHLSQVWAQTAAMHFSMGSVQTYSGGTEATACNPRTIAALRRAGFSIRQLTGGSNPHYRIRFAKQAEPIEAFSKVYSDTKAGNPDAGFIAVMCCSQADRECPVVTGSTTRIPLHYDDPKVADNTPAESAKYDERCRQIAVEMFYVMNQVALETRS